MAFKPSERLSRTSDGQSLNLIPMLNLFLVLIPMLITMVVTVKLTIMQLNLPSPDKTSSAQKQKKSMKEREKRDDLIVVLTNEKNILVLGYPEDISSNNIIRLGKGKNAQSAIRIPRTNKKFSFDMLNRYIVRIRENYPDWTKVRFGSDDDVQYGDIISAMDLCRRNGLSDINIVDLNTVGLKRK